MGGAFLLIALKAPRAFAWSEGGHLTVAAIAYSRLEAGTRQKVDVLLQQHPDANKWMQQRMASDPPVGQYLFMRASLWPDEIRSSSTNPFNHPEWHYVDYPLLTPYQNVPTNVASPFPTNDVLTGIKESETVAATPTSPLPARAAYLSWLIHLVGDIHQPLHCATLIKPPTFAAPIGDKGGNYSFVKVNGHGTKLHTLWDHLLSDPTISISPNDPPQVKLMKLSQEIHSADQNATNLQHLFPRTAFASFLNTPVNVRQWSLDSSRLALASGYLNGQLPIGTSAGNSVPLPAGYMAHSTDVAQRQGALAGYRLADEINRLFPMSL